MKLLQSVLVGLSCFLLSGLANANQELARSKNCFACHAVNGRMFGPSFKDIAAKYESTLGADEMLSQKIRRGGSGNWGNAPMPPNNQVTETEARALAKWVLSLR